MKRNLFGRFSKRTSFKLPYQDNLKVILVFVYLLIIAFSGTYVVEAKEFHHNFIKYLYEPKKLTIENVGRCDKSSESPKGNDRGSHEGYRKELPGATIKRIAKEENFAEIDMLLKIAKCESSMNPNAINVNRDGSIDAGIFQINEYWHGADRNCHLDVACATRKAIKIQRKAGSFMPWVCFWKYNL